MRGVSAAVAFCVLLSWTGRSRADYFYTTLVPFGSNVGTAYGINDQGDVVGNYVTSGGASNGFLYSGGGYTSISYSLFTGTSVAGINNLGSMVGFYYLPFDSNPGGFRIDGGVINGLEIPDSRYTQALGVNNLGQIVGLFEGTRGGRHGFIVDGLTYKQIDVGADTTLSGINDKGDMVGSYLGMDGFYHGFVYHPDGTFDTITVAGATETHAMGINQLGQIVGYYVDANGVAHGFLNVGGNITTIDASNALGTYVYGINSQGSIVGEYLGAADSTFHPFLGTPTPEPASIVSAVIGLTLAAAGLAWGRRAG
ncbi:hypothetical protein [Paludisphaera rhizosphaerae]|uniref:hypothetical protein n=1 Tax=Paludisphaera rhizosphaerae TaxID=2711216 RepID=UPI0013EBDBA6|nr:hypothetical protein [Paludisphaera rhizosphaerae]